MLGSLLDQDEIEEFMAEADAVLTHNTLDPIYRSTQLIFILK